MDDKKLPAAAAASAMQWSIDLDKALRSRHPATRLHAIDAVAPRLRELGASPAAASALGVLPSEPRLFAHTILLRLATHFTTAHNAVRARILRALLLAYDGSLPITCVAPPESQHQLLLTRVKAAYDAGCPHARALALRMFGCLAHLAHHSLHLRSLLLSTFSSSNAPQVKAALFAAACFSRLSVDFSYITLEALRRLISSPTSQPQIIIAAIKIFPKLDCTLAVIHRVHEVGKEIVLGTLEDNFKADMLLSLSRLASKSVVLFGNQVELLLLFLEHESSHCMKTVSLKCLCFMFHGSICHFPVLRTVFGTLLQLIDDDDFPLDCKRDAFMVLQKIVCGKAPIVHFVDTCELSKLILVAESSLHSSSWEMQGSSLTYNGCQGITSNFLSAHVENSEDKFVHKIVTSMVNHNISLVNQIISTGNKEATRRHTYMSSELKMYRSMLSSMRKLLVCYPSAAAVALDKLRCLIKELARLDDSDCSEVSVANVESFQTNSAREVLDTSNGIVKPVSVSMKASHMGTDFDKLKFNPTEYISKKEVSIAHNIILWTLKFANSCHNILSKTPGASCNLYDSIKELIECVQQNASQCCSTYESFHLTMCACISWYACKTRDGNQEPGDSKEQPDIFFSPSVWLTQELCAIRITKMLFRNQRYWDAYRSAMYCCREGLWFVASSVFRKLADDFGSGSFSFWFKSLLLISAGEIEMKLLHFPSAIIKLVNELKTDCNLHENFYLVETNVDSSLADSSELHGSRAKITDICSRTFLATDPLLSNTSSSRELFFQRWFISLRASFLEILADFLGILTAHLTDQRDKSHHDAIGDHSNVPREHNNSHLLALANCSLGLSELAHSYDLLAVSHGDMDHQSFSIIARLAFMCSLLAFCTAFSVDFSKVHSSVESCRLPESFSHASVVQDLHERVDRTDSQIVSQLHQLMPICCDEVHSIQIVTRMNCSGILEKDSYRLCKFAVAYLFRLCGDTKGIATGEDSVSPLHGGMQFLSSILQRVMELPFVLPKYFFRVRPCFGAELHIYDSNPENRDGISVPSGFQLSLTLCLQWKCVLERSDIDISKLYCVLAASSASCCLDVTGTKSKEFEIPKKTAGMVGLNTKLMQYIEDDLRKKREKKRRKVRVEEKDMVTAFARFEASDSGMGFSSCLLDVSEFPQGSYKMKWHACCIDKDGAYYSLLPLNDGAAFSVRKS
uniref:Integrator complex subunit 7 n=1 Tax=Oryza punctata TaxID=4537 RepID=A0A0E0JD29_ORYPU